MNIALALLAAARTWSDNIAIAGLDGTRVRYGELAARARAIAGALSRRGLEPGDRVALSASNAPEYFECLLGIWTAGLCAVPLNPRLHPREFEYAIRNSGAKLCFATGDLAPHLVDAGCGVVRIGSVDFVRMCEGVQLAPVERVPEDIAWLFYTSGTTGRPKGAMLSHRNLMAFIVSMLADGGAAVHDNVLHIAPLSHGSGFLGLVYLMRGRTNVVLLQGGLERDAVFGALNGFSPLSVFAVPTVIQTLMDKLVPREMVANIHMIYFGGAPMYVDDLKRAIAFFGAERLWHLYGQGEAPMTITYLPPWLRDVSGTAKYETQLASVGIARTGVAVRVVDEDGADCAPGQVGEVVVRGDVVMSGYWDNPEATDAAFRDGWLRTGDLGALDEAGFLTLHDRSKDMIIAGGSNIYPREIEEVLLTHPDVRECAVVGVRDPKWGEVPAAFIVWSGSAAFNPTALEEHCLAHLARFKRPRHYFVVAELPKNGYGKVLKTELRELAQSGRAEQSVSSCERRAPRYRP